MKVLEVELKASVEANNLVAKLYDEMLTQLAVDVTSPKCYAFFTSGIKRRQGMDEL